MRAKRSEEREEYEVALADRNDARHRLEVAKRALADGAQGDWWFDAMVQATKATADLERAEDLLREARRALPQNEREDDDE